MSVRVPNDIAAICENGMKRVPVPFVKCTLNENSILGPPRPGLNANATTFVPAGGKGPSPVWMKREKEQKKKRRDRYELIHTDEQKEEVLREHIYELEHNKVQEEQVPKNMVYERSHREAQVEHETSEDDEELDLIEERTKPGYAQPTRKLVPEDYYRCHVVPRTRKLHQPVPAHPHIYPFSLWIKWKSPNQWTHPAPPHTLMLAKPHASFELKPFKFVGKRSGTHATVDSASDIDFDAL